MITEKVYTICTLYTTRTQVWVINDNKEKYFMWIILCLSDKKTINDVENNNKMQCYECNAMNAM